MLKHFLVIIGMIATGVACGQTINSDSSYVSFEVSNLGINTVDGTITGMSGEVVFDESNLSAASFDVCITPETIKTGIKARDSHLRTDAYLGVEAFPKICFVSSSVSKTKDGYLAKGKLKIREVEQEAEIHFTYKSNRFQGSIVLDRFEYGVGGKGGFQVGREIEVKIYCLVN